MTDPLVQSYSRRLYEEEVTELDILKIGDDYLFEFGIYFTKGRSNEVLDIPESIGRFMTKNFFRHTTDYEL